MPAFAILQDPTRPVDFIDETKTMVKDLPATSGLTLSSVIVSKKRRLAVINDKSVTEGDFVDKFKVLTIHSDYVVVSSGGRIFTLHLFQEVLHASTGKSK